jgi:hypothetical protein
MDEHYFRIPCVNIVLSASFSPPQATHVVKYEQDYNRWLRHLTGRVSVPVSLYMPKPSVTDDTVLKPHKDMRPPQVPSSIAQGCPDYFKRHMYASMK